MVMAHWVKIIQAPLKVTYHGENTEAAIANLLGKLVFFFVKSVTFFFLCWLSWMDFCLFSTRLPM